MACMNDHHQRLDADGVGRCSVPMWINGCPAGFCDVDAYGKPLPGRRRPIYVPCLACPGHGGPPEPTLRIVFDGPLRSEGPRFVEVEDALGRGIQIGTWYKRDDGLWELILRRGKS